MPDDDYDALADLEGCYTVATTALRAQHRARRKLTAAEMLAEIETPISAALDRARKAGKL